MADLEFTSEADKGDALDAITLPVITFTVDGEKFSTVTEMDGATFLDWSELGMAAVDDIDAGSPEGAAYVARFLRTALGGDYQRWRRHVRAHHTPVSVVLKVVSGIQVEMSREVEDAAARPTVPSSPSSPGREGRDAEVRKLVSLQRGEVTYAPAPQDHKRSKKRAAASGN
jgi:hypothetical protein